MERESFEQDVHGGPVLLASPPTNISQRRGAAESDPPDPRCEPDIAPDAMDTTPDQSPLALTSPPDSCELNVPAADRSAGIDPGEVEALIFSSSRPLSLSVIASVVAGFEPDASDSAEGNPDARKAKAEAKRLAALVKEIGSIVSRLNEQYESAGRAFRIELVAGGYRVMTLPRYAPVLARLHHTRSNPKLSKPAIETLAIIAYQQPITRAKLEAIRGVSCGEVLKSLLERRLIAISGRAEELGRPMLYATTRQFLDHFGLSSVKDLPSPGELRL